MPCRILRQEFAIHGKEKHMGISAGQVFEFFSGIATHVPWGQMASSRLQNIMSEPGWKERVARRFVHQIEHNFPAPLSVPSMEVAQILKKLEEHPELVSRVVEFLRGFTTLTVNYTRTLSDMIDAGKYDWVNNDITQENFPHRHTGVIEREYNLFQFDHRILSEAVIREMEENGYKPADMATLCAFGEKFPDVQRQFPVVALGQLWQGLNNSHLGAYLLNHGSERGLGLHWFGLAWGTRCRFLAVRDLSAQTGK